MPGFKTHFPIKGVRTDVTITPLEDNIFSIALESTDAFDEDTNPRSETVASRNVPNLLVQKTKNGWAIMDEGTFDLNSEDLKALGNAIENQNSRFS
ncbi:hypothetical protein [Desertivirga arenae]|uniref:hypothetical protein n=1 Tax=Desertivirga arenae TaxID=2810309 RepID=UPI001A966AF2|nr:hypothetical protein [Pedobacter sp. SYSU D00823]